MARQRSQGQIVSDFDIKNFRSVFQIMDSLNFNNLTFQYQSRSESMCLGWS